MLNRKVNEIKEFKILLEYKSPTLFSLDGGVLSIDQIVDAIRLKI